MATFKRVAYILLGMVIVLVLSFGMFEVVQEILVPNTEIPKTVALERFNRSFCFMLGVGFVMAWNWIFGLKPAPEQKSADTPVAST